MNNLISILDGLPLVIVSLKLGIVKFLSIKLNILFEVRFRIHYNEQDFGLYIVLLWRKSKSAPKSVFPFEFVITGGIILIT